MDTILYLVSIRNFCEILKFYVTRIFFNNLELCLTYLISRQRPFPMAVLSGSVTSLINSKSPSPIAINITTAEIEFKEFLEKKNKDLFENLT